MPPFWAQLPVEVRDSRGCERARIHCNSQDVYEAYRIELRGVVFDFDEIEEFFAKHLEDDARLTWSLEVDVLSSTGWSTCTLRAAITAETRTLLSRWHVDWEGGFEDALADLRVALGEDETVRSCFFCKWSDYEPSTSTGHLGCFRAVKAEYEAIATSEDARTRKYAKERFHAERIWVDELNVCDEFERRPSGFGYRG